MLYVMDEEVVVRFLKTSRKARKQAACYPCQRRKVKCDRGSPCKVCIARGHSFLCSYGRQSEGSNTTLPESSTPTNYNGTISDDSATLEASDISVLRKELDKLRHEVHQNRTRHRRCQAAQTESRRLRTRCKEFEALYTSLKAGDWSAMSKLDKMMDSSPDVDSETISCSQSHDESDVSNLASARTPDSTTRESSLSESMNHNSSMGQFRVSQQSTGQPWVDGRQTNHKSPSPGVSMRISNLRLTHSSDGDVSKSVTTSDLAEANKTHIPEQRAHGAKDIARFTSPTRVTNSGHGQQQILGIAADQHQVASSLIFPQACFAMSPQYQPTIVAVPQQYRGQEPAKVSGTPYPVVIEASSASHGIFVPETMTVFPDSFWMQNTSYPPMAFTQYTDLMERSYADYCSRILVNS